jgi:outer membrane protein OmpA-like peptidoglycan-associated protein
MTVLVLLGAVFQILLCKQSFAQSVDASGGASGTLSSDPALPVSGSWMGSSAGQTVFIGAGFSFSDGSLVEYTLLDDDSLEIDPVVDDLFGLHLSAAIQATPRVSAAFALPIWLGSSGSQGLEGPKLGDLSLSVPVQLCRLNDSPFRCALMGYVELPTGSPANFLGDGVADVGALMGLHFQPGPLSLSLQAGGGAQKKRALSGLIAAEGQTVGGAYLRTGATVGVLLGERTGLHLESRIIRSLIEQDAVEEALPASLLSPAELMLTFRRSFGAGGDVYSGMSRGLSAGIGSARWRGLVGGGASIGRRPVLGGTPEWRFVVESPSGLPVPSAAIRVGDDELGQTDEEGLFDYKGVLDWSAGVEILTQDYLASVVEEPPQGSTELLVRLAWKPYSVSFSIQDSFGQPIDAEVKVTDLEGSWGQVKPEGDNVFALAPGRWRVEVNAEDYGSQSRDIVVVPGETAPVMEIVLFEVKGDTTLVQRILGPDGEPLEGARVLLDGEPLGTTGNGGVFEIASLTPGRHTLTIMADRFRELRETEVFLDSGKNEFEVSMQRMPGTVQVTATAAGGTVTDAIVRFTGPTRLPPTPLGDSGQREFGPLRPGTWDILVVSPTYGLQERRIIVPENSHELVEVDVVLQPEEEGGANLELRVIDPNGDPIAGAMVLLDGQQFGRLSNGGFVGLQGLKSGFRKIEIQAEQMIQLGGSEFLLSEGTQEALITMAWNPGATQISVRTREGAVTDATVRFIGPLPRAAEEIGRGGRALVVLQPGDWSLIVSSAKFGVQQRALRIEPESNQLHKVDVVLAREDGGLSDLTLQVFNPGGEPIAGAEVFLDGFSQGKTTRSGFKVTERLAGERRLEIRAPAYHTYVEMITLAEGESRHEAKLSWSKGAVFLGVTAGGAPVTDAVVRGIGPGVLAPVPVDSKGKRLLSLEPGDWQLLVSSEAYGFSQVAVNVDENAPGLVDVAVELEAVDEGFGQLLFRVRDQQDRLLKGARIQLDGKDLGAALDGTLLAEMLMPGEVNLLVEADGYQPFSRGDFTIRPGSEQFIVSMEPLSYKVSIRVTDGSGKPVDASVSFTGPSDLPSIQTGVSGEFHGWLPAGDWQVIAAATDLGPLRKSLKIDATKTEHTVDMKLMPTRIQARGKTVIPEKIGFDHDSARLTKAASPILDEISNFVISRPGLVLIEVQGHTDASGKIAYNQDLSRRRAYAVLAALVERGVAPERLSARGFGTQRPLVVGQGEKVYATNRRVEFEIMEQYEYEEPW